VGRATLSGHPGSRSISTGSQAVCTRSRSSRVSRETGFQGDRHLWTIDISNDEPKPKKLVDDIQGYELSANGEKLLVRKDGGFYVIPASSGADAKLSDARLDLSDWRFPVDPKEEWRQLFVDSWRLERDYFYDRKMHGVDWRAMLEKYLPLVDRVTTREEVQDLQGQMAGELSALHTFVGGGDVREGDTDVDPASLGARLLRDEAAGGYRIEHIYRADPDYPDELSPLAKPGVGVREGDVIESINGIPLLSISDPGAVLRDQAGEQVRLRVRSGRARRRTCATTSGSTRAGSRWTA
jgi:tricorn protease